MIDLDWKAILIGTAISIAVGHGIYARYLKEGFSVNQSQLFATELRNECATHIANPDSVKSKEFITRAKEALPKLKKADAASVVFGDANGDKIPSVSLLQCLDQVQSEVDKCELTIKFVH